MARPNPFCEPFTWRGLEFKWNGRQYRFEHKSDEHGSWWVTPLPYVNFGVFRDDMKQERERCIDWGQCRWVACANWGDAAARDDRESALEGALQASLAYHHGCIAKLRAISFGVTPLEAK